MTWVAASSRNPLVIRAGCDALVVTGLSWTDVNRNKALLYALSMCGFASI
jgi:hypothetical protein